MDLIFGKQTVRVLSQGYPHFPSDISKKGKKGFTIYEYICINEDAVKIYKYHICPICFERLSVFGGDHIVLRVFVVSGKDDIGNIDSLKNYSFEKRYESNWIMSPSRG